MRIPLKPRRILVARLVSSAALHLAGITLATPHDAAAAEAMPEIRLSRIPHSLSSERSCTPWTHL